MSRPDDHNDRAPAVTDQLPAFAADGSQALGSALTQSLIFDADAFAAVEKIATIMAKSSATLPQHLRGNVGDCMAIVMQAMAWGMNPWPVAQKTHVVGGVLGYEAQLVNAVITTMAPTEGRIEYEWFGDWGSVIGNFVEKTSQKGSKYLAPGWSLADEKGLGVKVWATIAGESAPRELSLLLSQAQPRNSTLWASDPKQQLAYLAVKRWARLYCPDVILGVYSSDELQPPEINITQSQSTSRTQQLKEKLASVETVIEGTIEPETKASNAKKKTAGASNISSADRMKMITEAIRAASNEQRLDAAIEGVNELGDEEKSVIRTHFKCRKMQLQGHPVHFEGGHITNLETGEIVG